jgi:DNA invertase Pin-like site-specific DNA recombinase
VSSQRVPPNPLDESGLDPLGPAGAGLLIGYARVSTAGQDLTAQQLALTGLGVSPERIYTDHGHTGRNRDRPGLAQALAACRQGDTLIVTKLDRLARSLTDARTIIDTLYSQGIKVSLGGTIHDPADPIGRFFLGTLSLMAEFETDLLRARTREGMAVARSKGKLKGKPPKLKPAQAAHLQQLHQAGNHTTTELAELFNVARSTIYRTLGRNRTAADQPRRGSTVGQSALAAATPRS